MNRLMIPIALAALILPAACTRAGVLVSNLVTDDQTVNSAAITDTNLKNPWGISHAPTSPFWVSDNGTGRATLYNINPGSNVPSTVPFVVTIPGDGSVTGQVNNPGSDFNGDSFLFVSEDGTVSGWRPLLGTTAEVLVLASTNNVYKGAALATIGANAYLYAANFKAGTIDVYKGNPGAPSLAGSLTDPGLPAGYAPFNIQNLGGKLYVAYALTDPLSKDDVPGAGHGFVSSFDTSGNFLARIATAGVLNSPWGLAIAPPGFENVAGDLLVGNFGDGRINAFNLTTLANDGFLRAPDNSPIVIPFLWALTPGDNSNAGNSSFIYFTSGPNDEANGLIGSLASVPEPTALALFLIAASTLASSRANPRRS